MMKGAGAYVRKGKWFFFTRCGITGGRGRLTRPPYSALPADSSSSEKGAEALKMLAASRDVPMPESLTDESHILPLYKLAGVRSWDGLARGAVGCNIDEDQGVLRVYDLRRKGRGFSLGKGGNIILPETASAQEIGEALEEVVRRNE